MKNDTIQKLAHDMRGFISCWREWKMPGSPFRLTDSDWFADFTKRAEALAGKPLRNCERFDSVKEAAIAFAHERKDQPQPCPDFMFSAWLLDPVNANESEVAK